MSRGVKPVYPASGGTRLFRAEMIGGFLSGTGDDQSRCDGSEPGLLARLRAGEQGAYEELVRQYGPAIYRLTCRILGDPEESRDVTQETFMKVFSHVDRLRDDGGFAKWMFRIAINQATNHQRWWRRRRRMQTFSLDSTPGEDVAGWADRIADPAATPEGDLLAKESEQLLLRALERVGTRFRTTLILRDIEGFSYDQISEILSISLGTVKSRIARGRALLRREMERLGWRPGPQLATTPGTRGSLEIAGRRP